MHRFFPAAGGVVARRTIAGALLAACLLVPIQAAGAHQPAARPLSGSAAETARPNLYELRDAASHTQITYSTSSISGQPLFSYRDPRLTRSFQGSQIRVQPSEIGTLVSVTLEQVPDLRTVTLTLLVPAINLQGTRTTFSTTAIYTTTRTGIGGPRLVKGPLQGYRAVSLRGTASMVVF